MEWEAMENRFGAAAAGVAADDKDDSNEAGKINENDGEFPVKPSDRTCVDVVLVADG